MENSKKVLGLLLEMGNVGDRIGRSKNWAEMMGLMDEVMALTSVDWKELVEECKAPDMPVLVEYAKEKLDLVNDDLEKNIEVSLAGMAGVAAAVLVWRS